MVPDDTVVPAPRAAATPGPATAPASAPLRLRALIVEDDTLVGLGLRAQLEQLGHTVLGQAGSAAEAIDLYATRLPDVVLLDIRLGSTDGLALATQLLAIRASPMVVISAFSDPELVERAAAAGVFGYLIKPVRIEALAAQLEVAAHRFAEQQRLRAEQERLIRENQQLTMTLEGRKLVERAKGIFMKKLGLDEPEAHRRLQLESQKRRLPLVELAKKIIEAEELLGGG
jgi:response regulator NasT